MVGASIPKSLLNSSNAVATTLACFAFASSGRTVLSSLRVSGVCWSVASAMNSSMEVWYTVHIPCCFSSVGKDLASESWADFLTSLSFSYRPASHVPMVPLIYRAMRFPAVETISPCRLWASCRTRREESIEVGG